jgi:hypothetical protein
MAELWTAEIRKKLATWADILAVANGIGCPGNRIPFRPLLGGIYLSSDSR